MRRVIAILVVSLVCGAAHTAFAQDRGDQAKPVPPAPTPAAQKEERAQEPRPVSAKMINVQVEVTITDQIGAAAPTKKTVSLITSDNSVGRVRSRAQTNSGPGGPKEINLNVDARPRVFGDQVELYLTLEYNPLKTASEGSTEAERVTPTQLNQQLQIVMASGKPMTVSQAADPVTDRKIVVEAKATILK